MMAVFIGAEQEHSLTGCQRKKARERERNFGDDRENDSHRAPSQITEMTHGDTVETEFKRLAADAEEDGNEWNKKLRCDRCGSCS